MYISQKKDSNPYYIEYDVIFIGQLGAAVCNLFYNSNKLAYKCLIINDCKKLIQPALLPTQSAEISIKKQSPKQCDHTSQTIYKIDADNNFIFMNNRKCYRYQYLIYGTSAEDWADFAMIQNLKQALTTNYSFVYSNVLKSQPNISHADVIFQRFQTLKKLSNHRRESCIVQDGTSANISELQNCINLIFYMPNPPHSGYDNINILYKFDEFIQCFHKKSMNFQKQDEKDKKKSEESEQFIKLNFILLLQGTSIFPQCYSIDSYIRQKIEQKGIKVLQNHKITKIDYLRRKLTIAYIEQDEDSVMSENPRSKVSITIKNKLQMSYDYLYVILQNKTPYLLSLSKINPYQNHGKYLFNLEHKNIFVIGSDLYQTTHSFEATNYQAHIIASNLLKLLKNSKAGQNCNSSSLMKKLLEYNGFTSFVLWVSCNYYICMQHQYENLSIRNQPESNKKRENTCVMKKKNYITDMPHCCLSIFEAPLKKFLHGVQISLFFNLKSYGAPYYFFVPQDPEFVS